MFWTTFRAFHRPNHEQHAGAVRRLFSNVLRSLSLRLKRPSQLESNLERNDRFSWRCGPCHGAELRAAVLRRLADARLPTRRHTWHPLTEKARPERRLTHTI
jgi:hypothetical protein